MTLKSKPAVREDTIPLIGFYSPSGCGKTYSALLFARGYVGPTGKIVLIDTESKRGSIYADQIEGGYDIIDVGSPFSPEKYIEAIVLAEKENVDFVIVDSASHEWEGIGGVRDMAAQREAKGKPGLHNWSVPKHEHDKFIQKLLGCSVPMIVCIRAKHKTKYQMINGKREVVKDENVSPIQSEEFIFEMTFHTEITANHSIKITKCSHPDLRTCFDEGYPIKPENGHRVAQWAKGDKDTTKAIDTLTAARTAASGGQQNLQTWWKAANQDVRKIANTIMDELKATAERVDNPPEKDLFPGDEQTQQTNS